MHIVRLEKQTSAISYINFLFRLDIVFKRSISFNKFYFEIILLFFSNKSRNFDSNILLNKALLLTVLKYYEFYICR